MKAKATAVVLLTFLTAATNDYLSNAIDLRGDLSGRMSCLKDIRNVKQETRLGPTLKRAHSSCLGTIR